MAGRNAPNDRVVEAVLDLVRPSSVVDVSGDDGWAIGLRNAGMAALTLVRDRGWHAPEMLADVTVVRQDPLRPWHGIPSADLALAIHPVASTPGDATALIASLCRASEAVVLVAPFPGLADQATPARWPAWWDSLFAAHGYAPSEALRLRMWDDDGVDIRLRQTIVLYGCPERLPSDPPPAQRWRSAVHPAAYAHLLQTTERRVQSALQAANAATLATHAELTEAARRIAELEHEVAVLRRGVDASPRSTAGPPADGTGRVRAAWTATATDLDAARRTIERLSVPRRRSFAGVLARRVKSPTLLPRVFGPPAWLFDESFYVRRYPDVVDAVLSPVWHYRRHGARQGRTPHRWFDAAWYLERNREAVGGLDPLSHFMRFGWREGRDPHPMFSVAAYLSLHRDVQRDGVNPLLHWLAEGGPRGRSPHPVFAVAWYASRQDGLGDSGVTAAEHFLDEGWRQGLDPHPLFHVDWYLDTYGDVAGAGINPLLHYLDVGWRQGRKPNPFFDAAWYSATYHDVAKAGVEPLTHYILQGAAEGRSPGPEFDTARYVEAHPEAAESGDPLAYYFEVGARRGHRPVRFD